MLAFLESFLVNEEFFFLPCHCDPAFKAQVPGGHLGKSPHALTKRDDGGSIRQLSWRHNAITILLAYERRNAEMCETARRARKLPFEMSVQEPATEHKVISTPVFRAKCEQSREACWSVRAGGELIACLGLRRVL